MIWNQGCSTICLERVALKWLKNRWCGKQRINEGFARVTNQLKWSLIDWDDDLYLRLYKAEISWVANPYCISKTFLLFVGIYLYYIHALHWFILFAIVSVIWNYHEFPMTVWNKKEYFLPMSRRGLAIVFESKTISGLSNMF